MRHQDSLQWSVTASQRLHQYTPLSGCAHSNHLRLSRSAQYVCERRKCAESASPISCCWRRQGCSVLLSTEWRTKGGRTTGDRTISSVGQTRGSPNSQIHAVDLLRPRRHTTDLTLRPAPSPSSEEDLHTGGSYATLMAFRIEKEKLAGEIFQLVCAYKDGNQQH